MDNTQRAWVEINLDSLAQNVIEIKKCLKPGVKLMGVIKANAYGHGVCESAKIVLENGVDQLAVAFVDEAIELRKAGFSVPILILGNSSFEVIDDLIEYDITPAVFSIDFAEELSKWAKNAGKTVKVHIKVDTGMHRIGFLYDGNILEQEKTIEKITRISKLPNIEIEGIFSHFATSDEEDESYTRKQFGLFTELTDTLLKAGISIPIKHIANSAALVRYPEMQLDMVRAGLVMYGMFPSKAVRRAGLSLKPIMTFKTRITALKELDKGASISYGRQYTTEAPTKIATIAVGYADGYSRLLSGKVNVLVNGAYAKQLGRICMDQCMIDVTNVNNINIGDEVILFGGDERGIIPIEEVAEQIGTINYEIACLVARRIPRVYIIDGKPTRSINYLCDEKGK
ncbi:MAG: alanine racemase [Clostridia bacterium]|nr:alanine racemase [Clostridia bacterium]